MVWIQKSLVVHGIQSVLWIVIDREVYHIPNHAEWKIALRTVVYRFFISLSKQRNVQPLIIHLGCIWPHLWRWPEKRFSFQKTFCVEKIAIPIIHLRLQMDLHSGQIYATLWVIDLTLSCRVCFLRVNISTIHRIVTSMNFKSTSSTLQPNDKIWCHLVVFHWMRYCSTFPKEFGDVFLVHILLLRNTLTEFCLMYLLKDFDYWLIR